MDRKERHIKENEGVERHEHLDADQIAESMPAKGKNQHRDHTRKINRLWLWLGVLVLVFILLYWLFSIGIFEDLAGYFNG